MANLTGIQALGKTDGRDAVSIFEEEHQVSLPGLTDCDVEVAVFLDTQCRLVRVTLSG